ncbi:hypothetical protein L915_12465 [Phytophthora nicotianae]|uniref:Uncharacterized protein n=1 Tax=Phytophthora nicotianae TaxID=4792 RepID=W2GIQ4_PHYNI|nr:hypothetical protein L915_12465 [Phytophthora nicotianae]
MAAEMKMTHELLYEQFNHIDLNAIRDSAVHLTEVKGTAVDEFKIITLLDITNFEVSEVTVPHVLDYVFYKEGGRPHSTGTKVGDTIFDTNRPETEASAPNALEETESMLSDGLSDSEDDEAEAVAEKALSTRNQKAKRRRLTPVATATVLLPGQVGKAIGAAPLGEEVDHLISLEHNGGVSADIGQSVGRRDLNAADKNQFQPTGMLTSIHLALVNGKYEQMTAQRFVESVQIYWRKFGFFPHPASRRRARVRGNDISNFSRKNTLPAVPAPADFSVIVGAVEILCAIAQQLYKPVVYETLMAALKFIGELRVRELLSSHEALSEVVAWLDDQLELFHLHITGADWQELDKVKSDFTSADEYFVRVHQIILHQDIIAAVKVVNASSNRQNYQVKNDSERRTVIPIEVRQALPKQGKKQICVRFLSAQGCRGKNGNCVIKNLCHFKHAAIPDIVRYYIDKNYGGLAEDLQ